MFFGGAMNDVLTKAASSEELADQMYRAIEMNDLDWLLSVAALGWTYGPVRKLSTAAADEGCEAARKRVEHPWWHPLELAAFDNSPECLAWLLERAKGEDPQNPRPVEMGRALHFAAQSMDSECALLLLEAGADPNALGDHGERPLHRAIFDGCAGAIEALAKAGADPNAIDLRGHSALTRAVGEGNPEPVAALLLAGADPWREQGGRGAGELARELDRFVERSDFLNSVWRSMGEAKALEDCATRAQQAGARRFGL
jgi:hypothetical protein